MRTKRIGETRSLGASLLSVANRFAHGLGLELGRHPGASTLEWHLKTLFDYEHVNCVLDVGANHGQFAQKLRELGYRGVIVSFEPVPDVFRELSRRMGADPKWRGFDVALGERDEVRDFHVAHGDAQASSFLDFNEEGPKRWGRDHTVKETVPIQMKRLDGLWGACVAGIEAPRVFLKMDCQGFDLNVVEGARGKLDQVVALQTELAVQHFYDGMTPFTEAVERYEQLGYDPVGFFPLARREPDYLRVVEMDCLFMRSPQETDPENAPR